MVLEISKLREAPFDAYSPNDYLANANIIFLNNLCPIGVMLDIQADDCFGHHSISNKVVKILVLNTVVDKVQTLLEFNTALAI